MNILFLTAARITDISERNIYTDLIRKFKDEGHHVFVVSPSERRFKESTRITRQGKVIILNVKTLNQLKTNFIEKGIGILLIERQFLSAIKKFFTKTHFDLVVYSTPPITLTGVVGYIKSMSNAKSYLLLKDIFPQNAIDLGLFRKNGLFHRFFQKKERELYDISDHIGCMSLANLEYIIDNQPSVDITKVEVNPNSIEPICGYLTPQDRVVVRNAYNVPQNCTTYIYGGNLGIPQGIDFLIEVLESNRKNDKAFFIVVGDGTEYPKINGWYQEVNPDNVLLLPRLLKPDYDELVQACDVGLIFLDHRFTIPNYPSRLLSYLECKMPIIAATDNYTDIGKDAENRGYGFWSESNDLAAFNAQIEKFSNNPQLIPVMGEKGFAFLMSNLTVSNTYQIIMNHFVKTNEKNYSC